jgi:hypothetical protein
MSQHREQDDRGVIDVGDGVGDEHLEGIEQAQPGSLRRKRVQRRRAEPDPEQQCRHDAAYDQRDGDRRERR